MSVKPPGALVYIGNAFANLANKIPRKKRSIQLREEVYRVCTWTQKKMYFHNCIFLTIWFSLLCIFTRGPLLERMPPMDKEKKEGQAQNNGEILDDDVLREDRS